MTINYAKEAKIHEMLADESVKDSRARRIYYRIS